MNISLKSLIVPGVILLLVLASWLSYASYKGEKKRADDAEQSAASAVTITDNVLRTIKITNIVLETNQYAKQQIALESQRAQADIKVAVASDDCARRTVPAGAADRLRQYADSLRTGSGGAAASKPDF
ncbi:DUF2570 domain-containing protein [Citrobacter freundii]|uniref:DUF2570 domain-containing protein n=1 Tax=Citrobacter portucalensis TaxID=1639133 RepID=A0A9X4GP76_9ENTR|nr:MULTISPECIES: DUF2570 domain-containing protein [Citrobacter freundii complex]MBA8033536.1 DUF2570 domain-containing protein [Citrobacter freundii]MDE9620990.1 DUF2570 domain-containing protein [Citrobacter portucalensis]